MQKYFRNKIAFQVLRDKGKVINPRDIDNEFYQLSKNINFSASILMNAIEGGILGVGEVINNSQNSNFLFFKNLGDRVVRAPITTCSARTTFNILANSFFIYDTNDNPTNIKQIQKSNNSNLGTNLIQAGFLKYINDSFVIKTITPEDFRQNTLDGFTKIARKRIPAREIGKRLAFRNKQITNFAIKWTSRPDWVYTYDRVLGDYSSVFKLEKYNDASNPQKPIQSYLDYIRTNGFRLGGKYEAIDYSQANEAELEKARQKHGVCDFSSKSLIKDVVEKGSITGFFSGDNSQRWLHSWFTKETGKKPNSGNFILADDSPAIGNMDIFFSGMFFDSKQIKTRHFSKTYFVYLDYRSRLSIVSFYKKSDGTQYGQDLNYLEGSTSFRIRHNLHVAPYQYEARHFTDNSITLNSISTMSRNKIPLSKFSDAFLTELGLI